MLHTKFVENYEKLREQLLNEYDCISKDEIMYNSNKYGKWYSPREMNNIKGYIDEFIVKCKTDKCVHPIDFQLFNAIETWQMDQSCYLVKSEKILQCGLCNENFTNFKYERKYNNKQYPSVEITDFKSIADCIFNTEIQLNDVKKVRSLCYIIPKEKICIDF
jgi:hypothetical protein